MPNFLAGGAAAPGLVALSSGLAAGHHHHGHLIRLLGLVVIVAVAAAAGLTVAALIRRRAHPAPRTRPSSGEEPGPGRAAAAVAARHLTKTYQLGRVEVRALDDVRVEIATGAMACIMGRSGSGKSTLLRQLGLIDRPTGGQIWPHGQEVAGLPTSPSRSPAARAPGRSTSTRPARSQASKSTHPGNRSSRPAAWLCEDGAQLGFRRQVRTRMKRLVEFPLDHGGSVLVEVTDPPSAPVTRGLKDPAALVQQADKTFEAATAAITPAARSLISRLRSIEDAPDEIGVEFGLQLSAQTGAFIASVAAEANFKVSMTWRRAETG